MQQGRFIDATPAQSHMCHKQNESQLFSGATTDYRTTKHY